MRRLWFGLFKLVVFSVSIGGMVAVMMVTWREAGYLGVLGEALLFIALFVIPSWEKISTLKIATTEILGMRTGIVLREGPVFVVPWLEKVIVFDYEVKNVRVEAQAFCKDGIALTAQGILAWQIDPELLSSRFLENRDNLEAELQSAIKSEFGMIAGAYGAMELKQSWESLGNLINSVLRAGTPPHIAEAIPPAGRLEFYGNSGFRNRLEREQRLDEERSEIENRYGINVISFTLEPPSFTDGTGELLENEGRAILKSKGDRVVAKTKQGIIKRMKKEGMDVAAANASAELAMGQGAERRIIDVGGLDKLKPLLPPSQSRGNGGPLCLAS